MTREMLHSSDRLLIWHLQIIGDALENDCPQSIIDWNRAIDAEVAERQARSIRVHRYPKAKRLPRQVRGITLK